MSDTTPTGEGEVRYTPHAINRCAYWLIAGFVLGAAVLFPASFFLPVYRGLAQLMSAMLLVVALFVASKYVFVSYTYILTPEKEGEPARFLVETKQGRRVSLLFQTPLHTVLSVVPYDKKHLPGGTFYTATATVYGGTYQTLHTKNEMGEAVLKMEADQPFLSALAAKITQAKDRHPAEEDMPDTEPAE